MNASPLPQLALIQRLRALCQADERLVAAMLYGSFARGEGDAWSDVDVLLFFADEALPHIEPRAWVSQLAPVALYYVNEFGTGTAIFEDLVRAEFHFDPASSLARLTEWRGRAWFPSPDSAVLVDRTGGLAERLGPLGAPPERDTPEMVQHLAYGLCNWVLFGSNVLARGNPARALEILTLVHDHVLRLARLCERQTDNWLSPTRAAEQELSLAAYRRYQACTASAEPGALWQAYLNAWQWGNEMLGTLAQRHPVSLPTALMDRLDERLRGLARPAHLFRE